ncbi:hypothetical protein DPEC_G00263600 [Dallia pectoralis]|uniref:Uncharacterized protein n=1 Tax=Dallia pectoralis TaxID=75939 RepID=A0ACC2FSA5_DALPE|nr:hypothetical protein DPEC_G00263600 [Dallia pectoralis]
MSLADQSQQWYPTSVQVTVFQARNLRIKGKNGTNDAYAIMQVAKDKFSTSVAEKCVAPVWKEEATFDLPLFHHGNAERCTLCVIVMHRAQVGLDKLLGQAVVNLLDLHDNKNRKKTDWYKLQGKNGKEDKVRGEVMLDIQFMRNNLSASMFDISLQDKPRSRIGKLKDKVRGKKNDGFSDSASAIVPSSSQALTDSDGEGDNNSVCSESPGAKKKSKLKTIFGHKSNLQRNVSQSMSTLGTLPEKDRPLGGSRASGLNVDSPDVKKKFKFLGHKRTDSNDSKVSTGPFSLLGRSKQKDDPNSTCINGNHVYAEEVEPRSGSTLSLNSSGQGSVEDVGNRRHPSDASVESLKGLAVPSYRKDPDNEDRTLLEQRRLREEEEKRQEEAKHKVQLKILQEEEEVKLKRQRDKQEDEAKRKRQREEEEKKRCEAEEQCRLAEEQRQQEEAKRTEEHKRQEEASVTERLSSLFGMIRKKEEKKDLPPNDSVEERSNPALKHLTTDLEVPAPAHAPNPFEEIPLVLDPPKNTAPTSAGVFLNSNRTAKVSAVKPRLVESLKQPETPDLDSHRPDYSSQSCAESPLSSVPSESPDMFSNLHSSLAPPKARKGSSTSYSSTESLNAMGPTPNGSDKKRRAPLPPGPTEPKSHGKPGSDRTASVKSVDVEVDSKTPARSLPDYNSLFPQKRHGIQGQIPWDNVIAEVNKKQRVYTPQLIGEEMSVDGPDLDSPASVHDNKHAAYMQHSRAEHLRQKPTQVQGLQSMSSSVSANSLPLVTSTSKPVTAASRRSVGDSGTKQYPSTSLSKPFAERNNAFASKVLISSNPMAHSRDVPVTKPLKDTRKVLNVSNSAPSDSKSVLQSEPSSRPTPIDVRVSPTTDATKDLTPPPKEIPVAKPRQRLVTKEPARQAELEKALADFTPVVQKNRTEMRVTSDTRELKGSYPAVVKNTEATTNRGKTSSTGFPEGNIMKDMQERITAEKVAKPDLFPIAEVLHEVPSAQPEQSHPEEDIFTEVSQTGTLDERRIATDELDSCFVPHNPTDLLSNCNVSDPEELSPAFQRGFSQRNKKKAAPLPQSNLSKKGATERDELNRQDTAARESKTFRSARVESVIRETHADDTSRSKRYVQENVETEARKEECEADPFATISPLASIPECAEASQTFVAEPSPLAVPGGKTQLRAWVSPSETQPVAVLSSSGGGPTSTPRRPHAVKPMSAMETQAPVSTAVVREINMSDGSLGKIKVPSQVETGPYTQLTQEELITLVVKQQTELSKKDTKIVELEEYIDNLLVRVIEENPSILLGLHSTKQAL